MPQESSTGASRPIPTQGSRDARIGSLSLEDQCRVALALPTVIPHLQGTLFWQVVGEVAPLFGCLSLRC